MNELTIDKLEIREVVENWVVFRDSADWRRFATVWHTDGWMTATWFQGPAEEFIEVSRTGFEAGVNILHQLGGWSCEIVETRAISQVKMTIHQRASVQGVLADAVCWGRFYDFFEKRGGRWAIVRRQPIYEKDRLDPVDPGARLTLEADYGALLVKNGVPVGYGYAALLFDRADLGINVFPTYRAGESAFAFARFAALLRRHFGARTLLVLALARFFGHAQPIHTERRLELRLAQLIIARHQSGYALVVGDVDERLHETRRRLFEERRDFLDRGGAGRRDLGDPAGGEPRRLGVRGACFLDVGGVVAGIAAENHVLAGLREHLELV